MAESPLVSRVQETLTKLVELPSTSKNEESVRTYLRNHFGHLGMSVSEDEAGNLIVLVPTTEGLQESRPLLLNAHMDRVPPGLGCTPVVRDGNMYSDGSTNLGADDAAGITIILLVVEELRKRNLPHGPLTLLFTVAEEIGLLGAYAFDAGHWGVSEGIIFDNADVPGAVVTQGAAYVAFDATLEGQGGHPGKDLASTVNAIEMFRRVPLPVGELDDGNTRLNIGTLHVGEARNVIPAQLNLTGELRTWLGTESQIQWCAKIEAAFSEAAQALGGSAKVSFKTLAESYTIEESEPLLQAYRAAVEAHNLPFQTVSTFVASDANALRKSLRVFTVSTGVTNEHTLGEEVALAPLASIVETTTSLITSYRSAETGI